MTGSIASDESGVAVALEYDGDLDAAPKVIAKGQGRIAEQIIALAKAHNIEIHEDAELAQMLSVLEIDSMIPVEAYTAVAEVLSYIYRANNELKQPKG